MLPDLRLHQHLQFAAVDEFFAELAIGKKYFPKTIACQFQRVLIAVPVVEVAHQRKVMRRWCPFAVPPTVTTLVVIEAQELVRRSEGFEAAVTANNTVKPFFIFVVACIHRIGDGVEPGVVLYEWESYIFFF